MGACLAVTALVALAGAPSSAQDGEGDGASEASEVWAAADGYGIEVDATGFELPSAIAFVPDPGSEPDDPLYFVTELRGGLKVVTNDRTVHEFARVEVVQPEQEFPESEGESGMAGICLDPERGDVFVTYVYEDEDGLLRNAIRRFETGSPTFALEPTGSTDLLPILDDQPSAISHQIGNCAVDRDALYVGIGDGASPVNSHDPDLLVGKILRMTLDGEPHPDNPTPGAADEPSAYVFASGLRNPFGIAVVDGQVYVAENGLGIDRLHRVIPGHEYAWDGTDESLLFEPGFVITPSASPVQLAAATPGTPLHDQLGSALVTAIAGTGNATPGVLAAPYDFEAERFAGPGETLVEYAREWDAPTGVGTVTGVAFGPDGLYFVPLVPTGDGPQSVLKLVPDPEDAYPTRLGAGEGPALALIEEKGCRGCHMIDGEGGTAGPVLSGNALRLDLLNRLESEAYQAKLDALDELDEEPWASTDDLRDSVRSASGDEMVWAYLRAQILEPRFDDRESAMPNLDLTEDEAELIADYLVGEQPTSLIERIKDSKPLIAITFFAAGAAAVAGLVALVALVVYLRRRSRRRQLATAA